MTGTERTAPWQRATGALCGALVLVLVLLAASPAAHRWLHGDSERGEHECAVTVFSHGAPPIVPLSAPTPPPPFPVSPSAVAAIVPIVAPGHLLPYAAAPPA